MTDPVDGIQSMTWDKLERTNPPQCFYAPSIDAVLATGEHVEMKQHFKLRNGASGRFGRILFWENKKFALQLYAQGTDADGICLPNMPQSLQCPKKRTYIGYPPEVIPTNLVRWYYPAAIADTAFIFTREQVEEGYAGLSIGMGNAGCVRYQFDFDNNLLSPAEGFKSFPDKPRTSFSKIGWQLVCKVARHMQLSLGKSRIGDSPSSSFKFDVSDCEWAYLSFRLAGLSNFKRPGASSIRMVRERGTQETNRQKVQKQLIKIDSIEALTIFKSVFGDNCTAGVRKKFPTAPKTFMGSLKFGHSFQSLDNVDEVNLVTGLQEISPTIYAYDRKERGIVIRYDPILEKLQVSVKFKKVRAESADVRIALKLDSQRRQQRGRLSSDTEEEEPLLSADESVDFSVNDTLSGEDACFSIQRIENGRVFCIVSETDVPDTYTIGDTVEFTLNQARSMI
jgi:hypothetical protein